MRTRTTAWLAAFALAGYAAWILAPLLWVALGSLKTDAAVFGDSLGLPDPADLRWDNYARAWTQARLGAYLFNSVVVTAATAVLVTLLGAMAAHALTRFAHPWRGPLFWLFVAGLMVPAQVAAVPLFFLVRMLGLLDSLPGLVLVYTANGLPFAVLVMAAFLRSVPRALHEAAVIDGCSETGAFFRVVLPVVRPGLIAVAVLQGIGTWREYFHAYLLLSGAGSDAQRTLPLGIANLAVTSQYEADLGLLLAGLVIAFLPVALAYALLQRRIASGLTAGAVK
jgi:ABC-type glycerol-3-phosphate transport system permease component